MKASLWASKTCRRLGPPQRTLVKTSRLSCCPSYCTPSKICVPASLHCMSNLAMERSSQTSGDVYFHAIDGVEEMGRYCIGGYHPVSIGDRLNARYRVVHKLGHGSYSTVWLARDEQLQRLVAVKVCTADASGQESKILSILKSSSNVGHDDSVMSGRDMIPSVLDTFCVHGPHGTHTCLVTECVRCTLDDARRRSWGLPLDLSVARAIAAQFVLAVAYMHRNGYVHGDLHVGNIHLRHLENLDHLSDEELYEEFWEPEYAPVKTFHDKRIPPTVPIAAILPLRFPVRTDQLSLSEARILLADFGESYRPSEEQRLACRTPVHCRPPEDRFEPSEPRSFPSDIWTLACSIWGIIGQQSLFESFMPCEDKTASIQVELLGKLPPEWWARWETRSEYFTEDGEILDDDRHLWTWEFQFETTVQEWRRERGMEIVGLEEKEALYAMLKPMLAYKPTERCSVSDVLKSKWMTEWGMPGYEKLLMREKGLKE
ncbi:hypothetical protein J3459_017565 [Metarhizium acridum]|nr:hypothetical protein J3459_017565 [Metarhizium acridum]